MPCSWCGYERGRKKPRPRSLIDLVAQAIYNNAKRIGTSCCGKPEHECDCWTGSRVEARAAIEAIREEDDRRLRSKLGALREIQEYRRTARVRRSVKAAKERAR